MTSICVTIRERTSLSALSVSRKCRFVGAQLVEVRLDHLDEIDWDRPHQKELGPLGLRSIITLRPEWEGGRFKGSEDARCRVLGRMIGLSPDLVDIELRMKTALRDTLISKARKNGVSVIVSYHDHACTPSLEEMSRTLEECMEAGGDLVKLAYRTETVEEALRVLELSKIASESGLRYAIMGMGPFGHITRVLAPLLDCELVYACLDDPAATDQIDIRTLKHIWSIAGLGDGVDDV